MTDNDNVIISIKGSQVNAESGPEEMELVTPGRLVRDAQGRYTISYEESELTGLEGTTTVLQIEGGRVTLLREGSVNSQMVFEEGCRHLSMYETPYGALSVGINTRRMKNTVGGGRRRSGDRLRRGDRQPAGRTEPVPHERKAGSGAEVETVSAASAERGRKFKR